jgi:hypothetical protein
MEVIGVTSGRPPSDASAMLDAPWHPDEALKNALQVVADVEHELGLTPNVLYEASHCPDRWTGGAVAPHTRLTLLHAQLVVAAARQFIELCGTDSTPERRDAATLPAPTATWRCPTRSQRARVPNVHPDRFRHDAGHRLVEAVDLPTVAAWLGHEVQGGAALDAIRLLRQRRQGWHQRRARPLTRMTTPSPKRPWPERFMARSDCRGCSSAKADNLCGQNHHSG